MPRTYRLALIGALLLTQPVLAADEPPAYKIVLPTGEAHELLPKTCTVCHKDDNWKFFLVAAPGQEGLDTAIAVLKSKGLLHHDQVERPKNVHAVTACPFCHVETPRQGDDPATMKFRTLEGASAPLDEVYRLCEMCHPKAKEGHARVVGGGDAASELAAAGLPVREGKVVCSTCHDMHEKDVGPAGVRKQYLVFAKDSHRSRPHGNRAACRACHPTELAAGSNPVFYEDDASKRCARCHKADHGRIHPVASKPSDKTYPMSFLNYPLDPDGRLNCSTCHDHVCIGKPDSADRNFLRGGPYNYFIDFCYRCHPRGGLGSLNPHVQVDSNGNVLEAVCTFCHKTAPSGESYDPEELLYLHSMVELCIRCHDQGPHPATNHLVEVPEAMAKQLKAYEKRHRVILPLDPQGRVVCTTCHNPHDKGVLRDEAALGAGETMKWRVPSFSELCTPCHARFD